jgi:hypothetical protein
MSKEVVGVRGIAVAAMLGVCALAPAASSADPTISVAGGVSICTYFVPSADQCPHYATMPTKVRFGPGGRVLLEHLRWVDWGQSNAYATGVARTAGSGGHRYTYRKALAGASGIAPCGADMVYERLSVVTSTVPSATTVRATRAPTR